MPAVCYEISLVGRGPQGEAIVNVFHYGTQAGAGDAPEAEAIVTAFNDQILPTFLQAVTSDWKGFEIRAVVVQGPVLGRDFSMSIISAVGGQAPPSAPLQTTAIVRLKASAGGRHGRGRKYISPVVKTQVDVNGLFTDIGGTMQDLADACAADMPVLEATYLPVLWDGVGQTQRIIVSSSVSPLAGVMRSRRARFPN